MDSHILLNLPSPFNRVQALRVRGNTNRETQMLSTVKYLKNKKYSTGFIDSQLMIIGYSKEDIQKAFKKLCINLDCN